ncbi:MAG: hypothetical protein HN487_07845 [Flavobacterium sp.]|jgi:hypothetical protein|nr:hypothetical protein [Flavobacterium sp.]
MIFSTTHTNKEAKELTNYLLGLPFSFYQSLKMGGIGSKRMIIEETSQNIVDYTNKISDVNYANIELRPEGIIVLLNKGLNNYNWVIPFRQLVIYKTDRLSIHAQGKYICFKNNMLYKENKKFIAKMIDLKTTHQEKYSSPAYE